MPIPSSSLRRDDGFTLVELLVAMTLSLIVLLATLQSLDLFSSSAAQQTRATNANDQVRASMDRTVADLRGASVILRASATDLVYAVPVTSSTNRIERLCVSTDLYSSSSTTGGTPVAPAAACNTGTKIATVKSTARTGFTYDGAPSSASPALVKDVGLTFSLDSSGGGKTGSSTLTASAARRSSGTLPITDADLDTTCDSTGALLSLNAGLASLGTLSITYATSGGISGALPLGTPFHVPSGVTSVVATVTDALGVTNTIRKDVTCAN
jgi:prepilin-type N-terminal cleavage/methylation domain-containing protein